MLFILLRNRQGDLTVLAIDPEVLDLDGVVVADRNAASFASLFLLAGEGIAALDETAVFAGWWNRSYQGNVSKWTDQAVM